MIVYAQRPERLIAPDPIIAQKAERGIPVTSLIGRLLVRIIDGYASLNITLHENEPSYIVKYYLSAENLQFYIKDVVNERIQSMKACISNKYPVTLLFVNQLRS
tara:strand:+ start:231 stop:542 length:312 start_codon:yes stop_codon:yes gene_type:complete